MEHLLAEQRSLAVVDTNEGETAEGFETWSQDNEPAIAHGARHERTGSLVSIRLSELEPLESHEALARLTQDAGTLEKTEIGDVRYSTEEIRANTEEDASPAHGPDATALEESLLDDRSPDCLASPVSAEGSETFEDHAQFSQAGRLSEITGSFRTFSTDATIQGPTAALDSEFEHVGSRSRSVSIESSKSSGSINVDWAELDKDEEKEQRDERTDESTAFLLARLDHENDALATNPKAGASVAHARNRSGSRPPSFQQLKRLVNEPAKSSLRYSLLPSPPPMTELEFWSALVRNYPQTAQRLPTLTSNKIRGGIPPPLRGVVWMSIAGSRDPVLEEEYDKLSMAPSPYEKLINKDIGRSFPGVDMFRHADGEGQKMLGRVLNAFSLWDQEIGYCQGLGFVVGPLLMHMGDKEAFCILVRLMEHYDLRSCFLPTLSGLHLRIYQFQHLLTKHLPELTAHLEELNVEPLYLSQWFLSFFGVTCPLPMLIRIYDVILTEGASETLMRVALSLMRRNEQRILAATEFEDVMQLLLSRGLWDTYGCDADDLVSDFVGWTGLVTREGLTNLELEFKNQQSPIVASKPSVHSAASRFLGRFWTGTSSTTSPKSTSPTTLTTPTRPASTLRRTPSKQSMASTLNSVESSETTQSAASTDATSVSRQGSADWVPGKPLVATNATASVKLAPNKDKNLHSQIEDLLTALSDMQREHSLLATELQREREEREEDRLVVGRVVERIKKRSVLAVIPEDSDKASSELETPLSPTSERSVGELEDHFAPPSRRSSLVLQTKQQLREETAHWKDMYHEEVTRSLELSRQLTDRDREVTNAREELREARSRIQDAFHDKQRLQKTNRDLRSRKNTLNDGSPDSPVVTSEQATSPCSTGLREFKLGRSSTSTMKIETQQPTPNYSKRISSLSAHNVLATDEHRPPESDALLLELVNSKTAEAVARQELEEVKGKLDNLRKLLSGNVTTPPVASVPIPSSRNRPASPASGVTTKGSEKEKEKEKDKPASPAVPAPSSASGGFFSGWGKRSVSGTA